MSLRMCNFYVYLHSTQGVDDSLDVTYECRSVALFALSAQAAVCVLMLMFCRLVLARGRPDTQSALTA